MRTSAEWLPADPEVVRDFVHIADVARLCVLAATAPLPGYTVLNAGSGHATRLCELVELAARLSRRPLDVKWLGPRATTIRRTHACMSVAEHTLGFRPAVSLEEGLAGTLDWFLATGVAGRSAR